MTGIEILTSAEVVTETVFNWAAFWTMICVGVGFGLILGIITILTEGLEWTDLPLLILVSVTISSIVGFGCGLSASTPIAYETQYKVIISDEVSANDFYEYYEVIEQDGKILTVREKTND